MATGDQQVSLLPSVKIEMFVQARKRERKGFFAVIRNPFQKGWPQIKFILNRAIQGNRLNLMIVIRKKAG
jgi:hypothetical protein